jgi:hypothetical protein
MVLIRSCLLPELPAVKPHTKVKLKWCLGRRGPRITWQMANLKTIMASDKVVLMGERRAELVEIFNLIDEDRSGTISIIEAEHFGEAFTMEAAMHRGEIGTQAGHVRPTQYASTLTVATHMDMCCVFVWMPQHWVPSACLLTWMTTRMVL